jgi:sporulation protein YlmC with PRC-barrel domain
MSPDPNASSPAGDPDELDAYYELLDRQIVDRDGRMVGKVDDLEVEQRADGTIVVTGLLTGPAALGPRIGGALGSIATASWSRLSGRAPDDPRRVDIGQVTELGTVVRLDIARESTDVDGFETWMRDRIISALPGARQDPR